MRKNTRENIKTVGTWTLQRWNLSTGDHTYVIDTEGHPAAHLYVHSLPDFENDRMVHTVAFSPVTRTMNLEEAAEYVEQARQALDAATKLQQALDSAEGN